MDPEMKMYFLFKKGGYSIIAMLVFLPKGTSQVVVSQW